MCVIAAKPAGIDMPNDKYLNNMFVNNPDGAGLMYAANGKVFIEKGYMKFGDIQAKLEELDKRYGLKDLPLVLHFRITTHGGTKPENCHPFPIASKPEILRKLSYRTDIGVAHNGIIDIYTSKDMSDTMAYIISQLAPLKKAVPKFYENRHLLEMISNAIDSKMVFMDKEGKMTFIGDFREEDGIKYSNNSYRYDKRVNKTCISYADHYGYLKSYFEEDDYYDVVQKNLMWIDSANGEYVMDRSGNIMDDCYAIDEFDAVYELDMESGVFYRTPCTAHNMLGMTLKFDPQSEWITKELAEE